ncbi:hypothetical protein D3C80_1480550 [compost metagenome]
MRQQLGSSAISSSLALNGAALPWVSKSARARMSVTPFCWAHRIASFSAPLAPVVASAMSGHSASAQLRASKMRAASSAPSADGAPRKATTAPRWRASPALRSRTARMACLASNCAAVRKLPLRLPFQAVQTSPVETVQASEAASRIRSAASAAASPARALAVASCSSTSAASDPSKSRSSRRITSRARSASRSIRPAAE